MTKQYTIIIEDDTEDGVQTVHILHDMYEEDDVFGQTVAWALSDKERAAFEAFIAELLEGDTVLFIEGALRPIE